jgi:uracil-DNA glycosylase
MTRTPRGRKEPRIPDRSRFDHRIVSPEGSPHPCLYLIGEAPGRHEADIGRPFVGPAGRALRDMMREVGIDASRVRLANAIPFRPLERSSRDQFRNRRPTESEVRTYGRSVLEDIAKVRPKLIGALGRSAATLFGASMPVEQARRRTFQFREMPVYVTYHPGFVLRFGGRGSPLWKSTVKDLSHFWSEAQDREKVSRRRAPLQQYRRSLGCRS